MKWIGLLMGLAFCAYCVVVPAAWAIKRFRRLRHHELALRAARGLCPHCGYDLTGNTSGVCPECGKRIQDTQTALAEANAQLKAADDNVWWA